MEVMTPLWGKDKASRVGSLALRTRLPHTLSLLPLAPKAMQRFEPGVEGSGRDAPRQRLLLLRVMDTKVKVGKGVGPAEQWAR